MQLENPLSSLLEVGKELPHDEGGHQTHKHGWAAQLADFVKTDFLQILWGLFPVFHSFRTYSRQDFIGDVKSSITVSFLLIPAGVAYSSLANVPPSSGLLSCIFPPLVYGLLGSSPQLAIGTEAMTSVLVGVSVHEELKHNPSMDPAVVASAIGILVGLVSIILGILQAGFIDNILSGYLLTGFVLGVANVIMIEQIPGLIGLPPLVGLETESAVMKLIAYCKNFPKWNVYSFILGLSSVVFLFTCKFIKNKYHFRIMDIIPDILVLIVVGIILSASLNLAQYNIRTIGVFNSSLVAPSIPSVLTWDFLNRHLAQVITIAIAGFFESQTVTRTFGLINNYFPSGDRELVALGLCNIVGGVFGGYVANGSLPRSKIQAVTGSRTTLTGFIAALLTLLYVLFLGNLFQYLPRPILAAVVFVASYRLIEFEEIHYIFKMRNIHEIIKFLATYLITIFFDVSTGILLCLLLAGLVIIQRSTTINVSLLGQINVSDANNAIKNAYVDIKEHPDAKFIPNLLILQIRGSLEFFNAGRMARRIEMLTEAVAKYTIQHTPLQSLSDFDPELHHNLLFIKSEFPDAHVSIVLDFSTNDNIDSAAILILEKIISKSHAFKSTQVYLCGLHYFHTLLFEKAGLIKLLGPEFVMNTVSDAIEQVKKHRTQRSSLRRESTHQALGSNLIGDHPIPTDSMPSDGNESNAISNQPQSLDRVTVFKMTQDPDSV
jgi:high affinity sulfate transporter 1